MKGKAHAYSARILTGLLEERHAKDVFVPECKMGEAGSRTLDGWALLPTWSPLTSIGYEIKVSRSDWLQDQKFEEYRSACHLFFVVAPKGVVQSGELPTGVGLIEPVGEGSGRRLLMRAKASRQEPDKAKLVRVMAHVLMWRKDQRSGFAQSREQRASFWKKWVDERQDFATIGRSVKGRMRTILAEAIKERQAAEFRAKQLEDADAVLRELGVTPGWDRWSTRRHVEEALRTEADATMAAIDDAVAKIEALRRRIEASRRTGTEG